MGVGGSCQPGYLLAEEVLRYSRGGFTGSSAGNFEGRLWDRWKTQIWKSARLTIERGESETLGTVFGWPGHFTGRDIASCRVKVEAVEFG